MCSSDLGRPLYYALRYARRLLATPVPAEIAAQAEAFAPPPPLGALMDRLAPVALLPETHARETRGRAAAILALYMRSHWLRMPPALLAAHLARKAMMRAFARGEEERTETA